LLDGTKIELANLSRAQDEKANADAVGVFLILVPISKLTGDHEGEIARIKGQVEAIETAQIKNKCSLPTPPSGSASAPSGQPSQ
jgi:hypothetical protein